MLQLSPCSLSQQRPLHLTLHALTSAVVRALKVRGALKSQAEEAGDRAGPRPPPRLRDLASPKDGQKALTVSVSTDSKKRKTESQDDAPQGPRKAKGNFRGDKNKGNKTMRVCSPHKYLQSEGD